MFIKTNNPSIRLHAEVVWVFSLHILALYFALSIYIFVIDQGFESLNIFRSHAAGKGPVVARF